MCGRYALYCSTILLAGCVLAQINDPALRLGTRRDRAPSERRFIDLCIRCFFEAWLVTQPIRGAERSALQSLSLRPGSYVLEVECKRTNAGVVVNGGVDFEISVEAGAAYLFDCAPEPDPACKQCAYENHFFLVKR
jgi:hypothetical protein